MEVSKIKIKKDFKLSIPSKKKMEACRNYFKETGTLDRDIIVNRQGYLCDGYIGYLILLENGVEEIQTICNKKVFQKERTYVFGCHSGNDKEYVWVIPKKVRGNIEAGSKLLVHTKFGTKTITATRVESLTKPPVDTPIKTVIRCLEN